MRPRIIGSIRKPALGRRRAVDELQVERDRSSCAPNMPKPTSTPRMVAIEKVGDLEQLERDERVVAHEPLDDDEGDDAERADDVADARRSSEPQPHSRPCSATSSSGTAATMTIAAPHQSMRTVVACVLAGMCRKRTTIDERDDADRHVDQEDPAPAGDEEDLGRRRRSRPPISGPMTLEMPKTARK